MKKLFLALVLIAGTHAVQAQAQKFIVSISVNKTLEFTSDGKYFGQIFTGSDGVADTMQMKTGREFGGMKPLAVVAPFLCTDDIGKDQVSYVIFVFRDKMNNIDKVRGNLVGERVISFSTFSLPPR